MTRMWARYCVSFEECARACVAKGFPQPPLTHSQCDFAEGSRSAPSAQHRFLRLTVSDCASLASLCSLTPTQKANMSFWIFHDHLVGTSWKPKPVITSETPQFWRHTVFWQQVFIWQSNSDTFVYCASEHISQGLFYIKWNISYFSTANKQFQWHALYCSRIPLGTLDGQDVLYGSTVRLHWNSVLWPVVVHLSWNIQSRAYQSAPKRSASAMLIASFYPSVVLLSK